MGLQKLKKLLDSADHKVRVCRDPLTVASGLVSVAGAVPVLGQSATPLKDGIEYLYSG